MAKKSDPDSPLEPKGGDDPPASAVPEVAGPEYAHTLSLRLTAVQYRRLHRFMAYQDEMTGQPITHQSFIEAAIEERLARFGL